MTNQFRPSAPYSTALFGVLALLASMVAGAPAANAFDFIIHYNTTSALLIDQGFDPDTADAIGLANLFTDFIEIANPAAHADDNQLDAASSRLVHKLTAAGDSLNECRRLDALLAFGSALHTVQDIYSHSNHIDNGIPIPDLLSLSGGSAFCDPAAGFAPGG